MKRLLWWLVGAALAAGIAAVAAWGSLRSSAAMPEGFAARVDTRALGALAVHTEGRLNSLESFARYTLKYVSGPHRINGQPAVYSYFDLMIRPDRYESADIVWIKNKAMRAELADALVQAGHDKAWAASFMKTGLISPELLQQPGVVRILDGWARDLIKTARFVDDIQGALHLMDPKLLSRQLRVIPPPQDGSGADRDTPWLSPNELYPQDAQAPALVGRLPGELVSRMRQTWKALVEAWRGEDAQGVNAAASEFASQLREANPSLYPAPDRLSAETLYFQLSHLTWVWVLYLVAVLLLLMSVAYRWDGARWAGMGAFGVAFALHTSAVALRWYVSGRWPNSNMFEAVTTSVWLGAVLALAMEFLARRSALRNLFALGSATASMAALMSAHYIPQLDANIRNMMPVLHDIWLYIHTNVIIASYAVIAMAAVTAGMYLVGRFFGAAPAAARAGGTDAVLDMTDDAPGTGASRRSAPMMAVLDGATLVLMEASFVMLWAGIVMGAIWADHSWGRPWGWDPKEVFALNTFLVFLVLVHVRLKVRDKGLWTALLAVFGCAVMLFNWIVINFVISGLHSYA